MIKIRFYCVKRSTKNTNKEGSLLIEALLSTVILSVSLTLIIQSMVMSLRSKNHVQEYVQAIIMAESSMASAFLEPDQIDSGGLEKKYDDPFEKYSYSASLGETAMDTENLKELNLSVTWKSGSRQNKLPLISYLYVPSDENK